MKLISIFALLFFTVLANAATIAPTTTAVPGRDERAIMFSWTPMATSDVGAPAQNPTYANRTVQASGTFGGATVVMEGSNDGTNWVTLTDTAATPANISFTATGLKKILQTTRYIRPNVTGGAAAAIKIDLLVVRDN